VRERHLTFFREFIFQFIALNMSGRPNVELDIGVQLAFSRSRFIQQIFTREREWEIASLKVAIINT